MNKPTERPFVPRETELDAIITGRQAMFARPIKPQPPDDGIKPFCSLPCLFFIVFFAG